MINYNAPGNKRPFGTFTEFLSGMFFGTIAPFWSQLAQHAFETSRMTRIGGIFGTANVVFIAGLFLFSYGLNYGYYHPETQVPTSDEEMPMFDGNSTDSVFVGYEDEVTTPYTIWPLVGIAVFVILTGILLLRSAAKSFATFLYDYSNAELESHEAVHVTSALGSRRDYVISFLICTFFPMIGGAIRLWCNKSLYSKYGIMKGVACHFFLWGAFHSAAFLPGLILLEIVDCHFKRALVCAGEPVQQCRGWSWRRRNVESASINA